MKTRIKAKQYKSLRIEYFPQYKYKYWPFWFNMKEMYFTGKKGCIFSSLRAAQSHAEKFMANYNAKKVNKITIIRNTDV